MDDDNNSRLSSFGLRDCDYFDVEKVGVSQLCISLNSLSSAEKPIIVSTCDCNSYGECSSAAENEVCALRKELERTQMELATKTRQYQQLSELQGLVDSEIHELTGSLFQEAYAKVSQATNQRLTSEKLLTEANDKIYTLQAEVAALKVLVSASLPSTSAKPQLGLTKGKRDKISILGHRRNRSDNVVSGVTINKTNEGSDEYLETRQLLEFKQIDPLLKDELDAWRCSQTSDTSHSFCKRLYDEDISLCMAFRNPELSSKVLQSAESNGLIMEPVKFAANNGAAPKTCALSLVSCVCTHRFQLANSSEWHYISQLCRNRIAAVCDILTYLRYVKQGLVKCHSDDLYWNIIRLRRNLAHARLGLGFLPFNQQS